MLLLAAITTLAACTQRQNRNVENTTDSVICYSAIVETLPSEEDSYRDDKFLKLQKDLVTGESLNEIRFANWTEEDSVDNPYFREIRNFLDGNKGDWDLDITKYNNYTIGKFVIFAFDTSSLGGLMVSILFIDHPQQMFDVWVYSFVDEETETVTGYEIRYFSAGERFNATPEQIRELLKEHPAKLF